MKTRITLVCMILMVFSLREAFAQEEPIISWDYSGLSFNEFTKKTEAGTGLKFYYLDEWVNSLRMVAFQGEVPLRQLLDDLFRNKEIYYYIDASGNVVITKGYAVKIPGKDEGADQNFIPPTDYEGRDDMQTEGVVTFDIGNPADRNKPGNVLLTGYINNTDTREPIAGVTVFNQKLAVGTISNEYGFYSITLPRGSYLLQFSFIGMKEKVADINLFSSGEMNVEMNSMLIPLKETVVSAQKNLVLQRYEVGVEKVNISSFRLMPTPLGESDIIKSVLLMPGVQSVGEGSAGFNVRGGSSDQNLILLYGAPLYNSSHFFGFFSAVNSDIIKDVTLYKGGIPARYGGRISSVLDISSAEGNRKEFKGNAGISPITTHLMVEGPLIKDTCTYLLTARSTYSNWIFKLLEDPSLNRSRASFYDLNGKITYDLNRNNKIDLAGYISHDSFRFNSDTAYTYNSNILAFRWRHFFTSRFFSVISVNNSNNQYDISSQSAAAEGFVLSHRINSTNLKADFNWFQGRNEINSGIDITAYSVLPGSYVPVGDSSLVVREILPREKAVEGSFYLDDKFILNDYISINAGIRLSAFAAYGKRPVLVYDPGYAKSKSTVTDTLNYGAGAIHKFYGGPEFRVSVNFRTSNTNSIKVNYNRTRQYLHLLSNTTSISPTDTWKLSDYHLKPQTGDQFAAGFYQMLLGKTIEASTEVYYKTIRNMVDFKGGTRLIMNDNIEQDLVPVEGKAYGLELMFKKTEGRIRWSAGYTFSRTFLRSVSSLSDETINGGRWFPANFDKPHDLILTFNYLYSRRFSLSANYTYSTGRPITYPVSTYYLNDILMIQYSDRNKYRIPDYSRLDLSFRFSGNLKSHKIAHPYWTFSIYNVLGRQNVYSIYFRNENKKINGYKLSVFGRAIPSVTFSFDF
jgi:hypothetical protein